MQKLDKAMQVLNDIVADERASSDNSSMDPAVRMQLLGNAQEEGLFTKDLAQTQRLYQDWKEGRTTISEVKKSLDTLSQRYEGAIPTAISYAIDDATRATAKLWGTELKIAEAKEGFQRAEKTPGQIMAERIDHLKLYSLGSINETESNKSFDIAQEIKNNLHIANNGLHPAVGSIGDPQRAQAALDRVISLCESIPWKEHAIIEQSTVDALEGIVKDLQGGVDKSLEKTAAITPPAPKKGDSVALG